MIVTRTISERTDDLPVVIHKLMELELDKIVDEELPKPHGNRKGMSYGQLTVLFLCYIMSQSDHRLCAVESWANSHRQTLEMVTRWPIGEHERA